MLIHLTIRVCRNMRLLALLSTRLFGRLLSMRLLVRLFACRRSSCRNSRDGRSRSSRLTFAFTLAFALAFLPLKEVDMLGDRLKIAILVDVRTMIAPDRLTTALLPV